MFETFRRGLRIVQVISKQGYDRKVTLRDIETGHVLPARHWWEPFAEKPRGFQPYDLLSFGRFPPYMLIAPRDTWASQFTCPKHGVCTDAMVTTKKTCAVPARNGQCDLDLVRGRHLIPETAPAQAGLPY